MLFSQEEKLCAAACRADLREVCHHLTEGVPVDCTNGFQLTPFLLAMQLGHLPVADFLLQYGANVNAKGTLIAKFN